MTVTVLSEALSKLKPLAPAKHEDHLFHNVLAFKAGESQLALQTMYFTEGHDFVNR